MSEQERRHELAAWIRSVVPSKDLGRTETGDKFLEVADWLSQPNVPELTREEWQLWQLEVFGIDVDLMNDVQREKANVELRRILEQREGEG